MRRTILLIGAILGAWLLASSQTNIAINHLMALHYADLLEEVSPPANPSAGVQRLYADINTHTVTCIQSDGSDCMPTSGGSGVPTNGIILTLQSACPTGFAEVAALSGAMPLGTVAANTDVGDTGGSDSITTVLNHTHTVNVNDPGHTHGLQRYPTTTGGSSGYTADTSMSGTPTAVTLPMASATTGITATTSNPAGGVASIDNRSAFVKVIFCAKS